MRTLILVAAAVASTQPAMAQGGPTPGAPDPCTLFKPTEITGFLGEPVEPGKKSTLDTGCSWYPKDDDSDSFAMINIWPKARADTPTLDKNIKPHPELGEGGYAIKDASIIGSWAGGVVLGQHFYRVVLVGPKATEANLVAWLKLALARGGGGK